MKRSRYMLWLGLWLIMLGIALFWVLHPVSAPLPKTSGHIQVAAEHALGGGNDVILLQLINSNDVYIANPRAFMPTLPPHLPSGTPVDIYYKGGAPRQILALQTYTASGQRATMYISAAYATSQFSLLNWRTLVPAVPALAGLLLLGYYLRLPGQEQAPRSSSILKI